MWRKISFEWEDKGSDIEYDNLMATLIELGADAIEEEEINPTTQSNTTKSKKPKPIKKWVE